MNELHDERNLCAYLNKMITTFPTFLWRLCLWHLNVVAYF